MLTPDLAAAGVVPPQSATPPPAPGPLNPQTLPPGAMDPMAMIMQALQPPSLPAGAPMGPLAPPAPLPSPLQGLNETEQLAGSLSIGLGTGGYAGQQTEMLAKAQAERERKLTARRAMAETFMKSGIPELEKWGIQEGQNIVKELGGQITSMDQVRLMDQLGQKQNQERIKTLIEVKKLELEQQKLKLKEDAPEKHVPAHILLYNLIDSYQREVAANGPETQLAKNLDMQIAGQKTRMLVEGATGISATGKVVAEGKQKPPEAAIQRHIAELNYGIKHGRKILDDLAKDPDIKPGVFRSLADKEIWEGVRLHDLWGGEALSSPKQQKYEAEISILLSTYRKIQSGLAVTNPEIAFSVGIVPESARAMTVEQFKAIVNWVEENREEMDRALEYANRLPGPPPQGAPSTPTAVQGPLAPTAPGAGWRIKE
jgi:hypothetical protein